MKEKMLSFFAKKGIYLTIASVIVCGTAVISSVVVIHNNNKKIDAALESLAVISSTQEDSTVDTTDNISEDSTVAPKNQNEPSGDKALQYIKEYDKLTAEYEAKKEKLEEQTSAPIFTKIYDPMTIDGFSPEVQEKLKEQIIEYSKEYESESASAAEAQAKANDAKNQLEKLKTQYKKDVAALKAKYGI